MKIIYTLALLLLSPVCFAEENPGKVCVNILNEVSKQLKLKITAKKATYQLNKLHLPNLCDFNSAIINFDGNDQFVCVYLGEKRALREGTNYLREGINYQ